MGIILKYIDKLKRARSHVRIAVRKAPMGMILKHFDEFHISHLHIRIAPTGIIFKHVDEIHRAHSHIIIAPMGINLKHVDKFHRARPRVRIALTGIILNKLCRTTSHVRIAQVYYFQTFL